jgi:hypothetical protein
MRKKLLLLCMAFLSLFGAHATTTTPINSTTNGSDVWYFIQLDRSGWGANATWLTGAPAGFPLNALAFNASDAQRWKVVTCGTGIALQNKAYGNYLNSDIVLGGSNPRITAKATLPTLALKFVLTSYSATRLSLIDNAAVITFNASNQGTALTPTTSFGVSISSQLQPTSGAGFAQNHSLQVYKESEIGVVTALKTAATALSGNTSLGNRIATAKTALDAANTAAATINTTKADTLTAIKNLSDAIIAYNAAPYTNLIVSSADASNEKWYLLKGQRTAATYATSLGAGLGVESRGFDNSDSQWWKIVTNGTAGYALKNKQTGEYLNTDIGVTIGNATNTPITTIATAPATSVVFNVSTAAGAPVGSVWIENINAYPGVVNNYFRLHDGVAPVVKDNVTNSADNCSWLIVDLNSVDLKSGLNSTITTVTAKLTTTTPTVPSLNPGNYPAQARTDLQTAINTATAAYNNSNLTNTDYLNATIALNAALTTYNASFILPFVSSVDATNEKWYFFQGQRPANTYLTNSVAGGAIIPATVIPDDTQLWKIVPNGAGVALVNKVTGSYINTDATNAGNNAVISSVTTMPVKPVHFVASNILTNGVTRFWVEDLSTTFASTATVNFRLHAGLTNILNYFGDRNDFSSWQLMDYSISLKGFLNDAITAAQAVVNDAIPVGTALGQYPADAKPTLTTAITVAQAVYNNATATDAQIKSAISALNAAVIVCNGSRGTAVVSTAQNPRWFVIKNMLRTDANAVTNQVISANGVAENGGLICETQANTNDQLWRFEASAIGGVKIVSAAQPTLAIQDAGYNVQQKFAAIANASSYIIDILGTGYKLTSTVGNPLHDNPAGLLYTWTDVAGSATNWTIEERTSPLFLPQTITFAAIPTKLTTGAAFNVGASTNAAGLTLTYVSSNTAVATVASDGTVTLKGIAGTSDITASNVGDATYAKASVKQTLTVTIPTGLQNVASGINLVVKNRVIVALGTNAPVRVFTVTGAEVDAKRALIPGIYIAKVAGNTVKVNVR